MKHNWMRRAAALALCGALLAVPMTAIAKMILERHATTKPLADCLAGRLLVFK